MNNKEFRKDLWQLALPVTLQCLLQSSFGVVDQIMTGQLGSVSIAGIGLSGKFISLITVLVSAIATVSGIIISQAVGKNDKKEISKGFYTNLILSLFLVMLFTIFSIGFPKKVMGIYSKDVETINVSAVYLRIYALSFLPMTLNCIVSAYLRCIQQAKIPLYAGIFAAILNTGLNYLLIFGKFGFPKLEVEGAAWASVVSQLAGCLVTVIFFIVKYVVNGQIPILLYTKSTEIKTYLHILLPLFACEFFWALGENVYGYIYGHMGTKACAAMTLINPVVSLMIGALSGVAQAAGIMIGRALGAGENDKAYILAKKLMKTGFIGSLILSVILICFNPLYVQIFQVEEDVREMTKGILAVFAVVSLIKVQNMILGGGVLRSGGKTGYMLVIDFIGTWIFGVPLGFLSAFVLDLPIAWVYFILSLEELVRLMISVVIFRKKIWIKQL